MAMASVTSDDEPDWLEVPGPKQVWNACSYYVCDDSAWEKPVDDDATWRMITTLEERELTESDLCEELLHLTPPDHYFSAPLPPPCSTLADCLLRAAAALGRPDTVALMLAHGGRLDFDASVLEYETCLGTPLVNACEAGDVEIARLLLDRSADVNALTRCCQFEHAWGADSVIHMDWMALHAACAWGHLDVVQLLVEHGADVNALYGYTLWEGVGPHRKATSRGGASAFHLACARGQLDVVTYLHQTIGSDLETMGTCYGFSLTDSWGHVAADMNPDSHIWLQAGVDYFEADLFGLVSGPDCYAVAGQEQFPDDRNRLNAGKAVTGTPLLLACVRGELDVIQYLLDAGADADARSTDMWTPLSVLKAFHHTEAEELLISGAAAGSHARQGARSTPIKTRAQRAGVQLEETPPAVRRDLAEGGRETHARAKAELRVIQKGRVQKVTRAEQAGTVIAALAQAKNTESKAMMRANKPSGASGSRRVYTCKKCGQPKKGHVCKV